MNPRISIAALVGVVALGGAGFAALKHPSPLVASVIFTATAVVLIVAAFRALRGERPFWIGFALTGWAHLLLAFGAKGETTPQPRLFTTFLMDCLVTWLEAGDAEVRKYIGQALRPVSDVTLYQIGLSLLTLLVALVGGLVASHRSEPGEGARR